MGGAVRNASQRPIEIPPSTTQTGTGKVGKQDAKTGDGTAVKRPVADFFKGIGKSFKALGDRIDAAQTKRTTKARESAANKTADKLASVFVKGRCRRTADAITEPAGPVPWSAGRSIGWSRTCPTPPPSCRCGTA